MAPEFEDGFFENATTAADIYSLGKLLYWLFTGKIFSRERHQDSSWDLKNAVPHPFLEQNLPMEHVARLLDQMIIAQIEQRAILEDVIKSVHRITRLLALDINPVSSTLPQRCRYCGWGTYRIAHRGNQVYNFGLQPVGNPDWRILVCNECGHCELFRLDLIDGNNWWNKDRR